MRRSLAALVLLLAATVAARELAAKRDRITQRMMEFRQALGGYAFFEFAPSSGAGLPSASTLCDAVAAVDPNWKSGQSSCWTPAGNAAGTTMFWGDAGTWTPSTDIVMPNGPTGASVNSIRVAAGSGWQTEPDTSAPAALSGCVYHASETTADNNFFGKGYHGSTAASGWFLERAPSSVIFRLSDGTTLSNGGSVSVTPVVGAPTIFCFRYVYSGTPGTTSTSQVCVDGVCGTVNTTTRGPINNASIRTVLGKDGSFVFVGRAFGIMTTEKDLGSAGLIAIENAVLARNPTGAKGEALTFTRASTAFCEQTAPDGGLWGGAGTMVPSNVPCITGGGLRVEAAQAGGGNLVVRSQELDNAAWSKVNGGAGTLPVVTQDYAVAPDGTKTAERVQVSACPSNGVDYSVVRQIPTTATGNHVGSFYVKGTSGSGTIAVVIYDSNSATGAWKACPYVSTEWRRCDSGLKSFGATANNQLQIGCNYASAVYAGSSDTGAADVLVWGAQLEGTSLTSYMPTAGVAAARADEQAYFAGITAPTAGVLSMAATYTGNRAAADTYNVLTYMNAGLTIYGTISNGANYGFETFNATSVRSSSGGTKGPTIAARVYGYNDGSFSGGGFNGTSWTPVAGTRDIHTADRLHLTTTTGRAVNGVISQVCYQPDNASRCR